MDYSKKRITFANVIELEKHIENLLLSNDCVIVPGLGGFVANRIDARYDDADHTYLPPLRMLGFNPKLHLNDSLLALSYVEAYDLSYPDAVHRIEDEVDELRQLLQNEGFYELNDIGVLRLNDEGNMEFTPCEAGILTPELYALSGFEVMPLAPIATAQEKPLRPKATEQAPANSTEDDPGQPTPAKMVCIKASVLRNAAVAAMFILAFFLFSTPLGQNDQQTASIDSGMLKRFMPKETIKGDAEVRTALEEKRKASQNAQEMAQKQQQPKELAPEPYYALVLASHVTKANAADYVARLKKQGIDARVVTNKSTKVIYGHYASESEAYNQLNRLSSNDAFKEAWVLYFQK